MVGIVAYFYFCGGNVMAMGGIYNSKRGEKK
jgi:hypothetical protein